MRLFNSSELRLSLLEIFDGFETLVTGVFDDFFALPICSYYRPVTDSHSGHLEGEQVHIWLNSSFAHRVVCRVEHRAVLQESAREPAKNDNLVLSDLDDAGALSLSELGGGDVDHYPRVGAILRVVSFNGIAVLFATLCDATEDEDEPIVIRATRVVMASDVEVRDFKPKVKVDVVLLAPLVGFIVLAATSSHNEELVIKTAEGVAMPGILHVVHSQTVKNIRLVVHDLKALFQ